jgi:hypothetical protein
MTNKEIIDQLKKKQRELRRAKSFFIASNLDKSQKMAVLFNQNLRLRSIVKELKGAK